MSVLPDDQMNSVINCLTAKSTWDDLILYHEGPFDVKESKVLMMKKDTRNSHEYLIDLGSEKYQARDYFYPALKDSSRRVLKGSAVQKQLTKLNATNVARKHKPELRPTKDFEAKYNKVKAKLALLIRGRSGHLRMSNEMVEVKVLMALAEENDAYLSKDKGTRDGGMGGIRSPSENEVGWLTEPISGLKTFKSILRSKFTFKAETLKNVKINEPSSAPAKDNKSSLASKVNSTPTGKLKSVKIEDDPPLAICVDIRWKPIWYLDSGCSRHITGVKSYLHKYVEQPGPKVVFGDDSTCTTEGYGFIKYEYSRYTWVYFLKKKSQAPETLMSFIKRVENQNDIKLKQLRTDNVYIHNHKDHLGKFDEKADDGYLLGYLLVSKAFRVFNIRRQQTKETYHIIFNESPDAIKFSKPLVDNINIAENERYPPDEYIHPYEPSQRYQTNSNDVSFIEPYECPELVVLETEVLSDQNGQTNQNDQSVQNDEILNDGHSEHSNHTNDEQIIDNLPNTKYIQISEHSSSPKVEDTSVQDTIPIPNPPLPIPSVVTLAPQDKWS
ncbi:hypothetical protein Tco_1385198 [Tanacetum coccineum]